MRLSRGACGHIAVFLLLDLVYGCGARVELPTDLFRPWNEDGGVLSVNDDVYPDRALTRPPRLEGGCNGETLPTPRDVRSIAGPTRLYPVTLFDQRRHRALVLGGLPRGGEHTREVYAVSTVSGAVQPLANTAQPMDLPIEAAIAWVEPGAAAVIIGGLYPSATFAPNVLRVEVEDTTVRIVSVGTSPVGPNVSAVAVYDERRNAVIVHGGAGTDRTDPRLLGRTWILRLRGLNAQWDVLLEADQSPPPAAARVGGVDPRTGAIILLGGETRDGRDRTVWSLSPGDRPRWTRLAGAADVIPRSGNALFWDPVACGFLIVGGRCADQLWVIRPEAGGVREAMLGSLREGMQSGLARLSAGVAFDSENRTLLAIAGVTCQNDGFVVRTNVLVTVR